MPRPSKKPASQVRAVKQEIRNGTAELRISSRDVYPRIWRTVERIPKGKVAAYGTIARLSGFPGQPRLAGYALFNLPDGIDIPWQRVINARGEISLPGKRGDEQRRLLEAEGVVFKGNRVDMKRFGWNGGK